MSETEIIFPRASLKKRLECGGRAVLKTVVLFLELLAVAGVLYLIWLAAGHIESAALAVLDALKAAFSAVGHFLALVFLAPATIVAGKLLAGLAILLVASLVVWKWLHYHFTEGRFSGKKPAPAKASPSEEEPVDWHFVRQLLLEVGIWLVFTGISLFVTYLAVRLHPDPKHTFLSTFTIVLIAQGILSIVPVLVWNKIDKRYLPGPKTRAAAVFLLAPLPLWGMELDRFTGPIFGIPAFLLGMAGGYLLMAAILGIAFSCDEESLLDKSRNWLAS